MWTRYNEKVAEFFGAAENEAIDSAPVLVAQDNWRKLLYDPDEKLTALNLPLGTFTTKKGDYRVYYAFLNAYHAIMRYYKYSAKYDLKDAELEGALTEWKLSVQPKNNILQNVISKFVKENHK